VHPPAIWEAFRVLLTLCKSKLHRATVTEAALDYEGSISIDAQLMQAAEIVPFERVQVVDVANGARLETYAIEEAPGSGIIRMNGAAARLVHVGDPVIIISYAQLTPQEAREHHPIIIVLDARNGIREQRRD
jgi:aspartate 1-decarboxylase